MAKSPSDSPQEASKSKHISNTSSVDSAYSDNSLYRLSAGSGLGSEQRSSHVQRISTHGAAIALTITEPRKSKIRYSYPVELEDTRFSAPPNITDLPVSKQQPSSRRSTFPSTYQRSTLSHEVRAIHYDEPQDSAAKHISRLWSPWPLRIPTLVAIITFSLGCIAALEVLSFLSRRDNGIRRWNETARFVWTYLPPLLFFILASIWNQVEYRTKQLMPWRTMANTPAAASHSILLNYITPLNLIAFTQSIGSGHPGVAVSIATGFVIKLLIIISTAALSLQNGILVLQTIPLRIMEGLLGFLVLLVAALIFLRPAPATPNDTSTIAGLAAILSNSPTYTSMLRSFSLASPERLEEEVYRHRYQTTVGYRGNEPFFRLSLASKEDTVLGSLLNSSSDATGPKNWWSPIHDLTRLTILAFILGCIVAVELLHQRSQDDNGFMKIEDSDPIRYAWQLVPAAISIIIFMLIGMLDHATKLIQPFQMLKRGNYPATRTIELNFLACMAPEAVFKALQTRHWGVASSGIAVLLTPFLTIVSSGMFFPSNGRLVQDNVSTRVVESLLGAIFLLQAVSAVISDTRRAMPYNPYSIARMSTLIAESALVDGLIPPGTEWASKKAIKEANIFSNLNFSLGYVEKQRAQRKVEKIYGIEVGDASTVA